MHVNITSERPPVDVFVHVPKTAGTSLRTAVIARYGLENTYVYKERTARLHAAESHDIEDILNRDTGGRLHNIVKDVIYASPQALRHRILNIRDGHLLTDDEVFSQAQAIIGHFTLNRFQSQIDNTSVRKITVLRDPLARMISHYNFVHQMQASKLPLTGWPGTSDTTLPFTEFALSEPVQNFQTQFTGTDPAKYDLLGTTENFADFLAAAGLRDSVEAVPYRNKTAPTFSVDKRTISPSFRSEFADFHSQDYAFYDVALQSGLSKPTTAPVI